MIKEIEKIILSREGNLVLRNSTVPNTDLSYDIGRHTAGMAQIFSIWYNYCLENPESENEIENIRYKECIDYILFHDSGFEWFTSDIPGNAKIESSGLKGAVSQIEDKIQERWGFVPLITEKEQRVIKLIDKLEYYFWCVDMTYQGLRTRKFHEALINTITSLTRKLEEQDSYFFKILKNKYADEDIKEELTRENYLT